MNSQIFSCVDVLGSDCLPILSVSVSLIIW